MKKLQYLLLILTTAFIFSKCSTDVEISAPYEQIIIVYGLLDATEDNSDSTYLKINKAFLGPDNALIMAQIPDSSEFIEKLDVKVWASEDPSMVYTFDTITVDNKEDGVFYNPYQRIYFSHFKPAPGTKYKLKVTYEGTEVSSETYTIEEFKSADITKPGFAKTVGFKYDIVNPVKWNKKDYAPRYDVVIRFHFKELWEGSTDTVYRFIDWHKDTKTATNESEVESYYNGSAFYSSLETYVPYDDASQEGLVLTRYTGNVEFIVDAGGEDLNIFMEVNAPSSSIIQDRPQYTNIENGIGIFSSRAQAIKVKRVNDETKSIIKEDYYWLKFQY